jgi:hypothetical protein
MNSLEQAAKALAEELAPTKACITHDFWIAGVVPIIQKHLDAFAREQNRELLKDKERLDAVLRGAHGMRVQLHMGYNNFSHEHIWKQTIMREDIDARLPLDKAALATEKSK